MILLICFFVYTFIVVIATFMSVKEVEKIIGEKIGLSGSVVLFLETMVYMPIILSSYLYKFITRKRGQIS